MSYVFSERDDRGTHIEIRLAKAKPKDASFLEHVVEEFRKNITNEFAALRAMLEHAQPDAEVGDPGFAASDIARRSRLS